MKKVLIVVLCVVLVCGVLVGCGGVPQAESVPEVSATQFTIEQADSVASIMAAESTLKPMDMEWWGISMALPEASKVSQPEDGSTIFGMTDDAFLVLNVMPVLQSGISEDGLLNDDSVIKTFMDDEAGKVDEKSVTLVDVAGGQGKAYEAIEETADNGAMSHRVLMFMLGENMFHLRFAYPEYAKAEGISLSNAIVSSIKSIR